MSSKVSLLIMVALLVLLAACDQKLGPLQPAATFSVEAFQVPTRLNVGKPRRYDVSFKITHPDGPGAIAAVLLSFLAADQSTVLQELPLYDDGAALHPQDRDLLAGDGIFSNTFVSDSTVFPRGALFLRATVTDNTDQSIESPLIAGLALINAAPKILFLQAPDSLLSGAAPQLFLAAVQDSNGIDDLVSVSLRLTRQGNLIFSGDLPLINRTADDTATFGASFDSSFAAERQGDYQLEVQAHDQSDDFSTILGRPIFLENFPPRLFNVELPGTFQRPPAGADTLVVRIAADDPQGLRDLQSVQVTVERQGGTPTLIDLFDDGDFAAHRDVAAGDGIYSRGLTVTSTSTPGIFRFTFQGQDRVGNLSPAVVDSLEILP